MAKREALSNTQRAAIRQRKAENPSLTQQALAELFSHEFGRPVRQSTISDTLKCKYTTPGSELVYPDQKKRRQPQFPDLEAALFQWQIRMEKVTQVTGEQLKEQAQRIWLVLPQYKDQVPPKWSEGWLTGFKHRYGIKLNRSRGGSKRGS